jgi:hypothetical protein
VTVTKNKVVTKSYTIQARFPKGEGDVKSDFRRRFRNGRYDRNGELIGDIEYTNYSSDYCWMAAAVLRKDVKVAAGFIQKYGGTDIEVIETVRTTIPLEDWK